MSILDHAAVEVGTVLPELRVCFTRETLVRYAGASGDFNPIHYSDHYAGLAGLPGVIAHGMLTLGAALRVATDWVGDPARIRGAFARFTKPVPVPDDRAGTEVVFSGTVTALEDGIATISLEARVDQTKVLGMATVTVDLHR